jgi:hypothetical protein
MAAESRAGADTPPGTASPKEAHMGKRNQVPSDRQRLDALSACDTIIIEGQRSQIKMVEAMQAELLHGLVAGTATLLGYRAVITWPDGPPFGLEGDELLKFFPLPAKSSASYVEDSARTFERLVASHKP